MFPSETALRSVQSSTGNRRSWAQKRPVRFESFRGFLFRVEGVSAAVGKTGLSQICEDTGLSDGFHVTQGAGLLTIGGFFCA